MADQQPRLQTGRLLSERRCLSIGPDQLAFSREETQALLAACAVHLDGEAVDELQRRTEGWGGGAAARGARADGPGTRADVREIDGAATAP